MRLNDSLRERSSCGANLGLCQYMASLIQNYLALVPKIFRAQPSMTEIASGIENSAARETRGRANSGNS